MDIITMIRVFMFALMIMLTLGPSSLDILSAAMLPLMLLLMLISLVKTTIYGPLDEDVVIDSQFKHALRGEHEIISSSHGETVTAKSKMVVQIEDGSAMDATLNTLEFSFGSDTQVNLDHTISLSPHKELIRSGLVCSRCRENMEQDDSESWCKLSKTTRTNEAEQTKGCAGGIELKETLTDPRNAVVTELQLADISDDVGTCWRELGPKLKIAASKIHNLDDEHKSNRDKANALLIIWTQQEGSKATVGHLAHILEGIGKKSIAEKLLESIAMMPTVFEDEVITLTVKYNLNADVDKLVLFEDTHGNKFILKGFKGSKGQWNHQEIEKNKQFLEKVAAAAQDMGKTAEQRRQESLTRISSKVQELRQQLKQVKLDCSDSETCTRMSDPKENEQPSKEQLLTDTKMPLQDAAHLLHSCEEQHTFCKGIFNVLIKLIGEVGQPREDNFRCIKQLCDFTKELKQQEKMFFRKIELLHNLKQHFEKLQVAQVEELEKWSRAQKEQVEGVEKLLSSLLIYNQGKIEKNQKRLNRRPSEPVTCGFRGRSKSSSSWSSKKSQTLSKRISAPLYVHNPLSILDTDKELKSEKS